MREWLLIGLVVMSVPLVLKRPLWGMAIYLGGNVVRPEMFFWGGSEGSYIFKVYFFMILAGMFLQHHYARLGRLARREFYLLLWFVAAILFSVIWAQFPVFRGNYYILELMKGIGVCALLFILIDEKKELSTLQDLLLACFAFLSVWGIDQHLRGNERLEGLGGGGWADSNGIAAMFVLFLPVAIARMCSLKGRRQFWIFLGVVALMLVFILCTKSRAGFFGLATALAMFGFYVRRPVRLALTVALVALLALPFVPEGFFERMKTMDGEAALENAIQDRVTLWKTGLMVFRDNPLIGTGFLTYPEAKMSYEHRFQNLDSDFSREIFRDENKKVTHNTYIQLLSDCGLFGAVPFMLVMGESIFIGFRVRRLLLRRPGDNADLLWLGGFSAGVAGYAVCIMSIDAVLNLMFYVQFTCAAIMYGKVVAEEQGHPLAAADRSSSPLAPDGSLICQ